ncbi:MAG: hypothetical protein RR356_04525 [Bacteroidales bacterium]
MKGETTVLDTTLQQFITEGEKEPKAIWVTGATFVSLSSNLLETKDKINSSPNIQDAFITQNGESNLPVLGLITNNMIIENMKC